MDSYALHYAYLNTCSWDWMVYKVVGEASGIFNDIAVFVGVLHTTLSLEVSLQWTAHLQKPVGISLLKERNGLFLDRLASSMMDGIHLPCSLACRDIVSAWAVAACLRLMPCVWAVAHPALPHLTAAGNLQGSLLALLVQSKHLRGVWGHWFIPPGRVGSQLTPLSSVTTERGSKCHINTSASCMECRTWLLWPCAVSQMPTDPWNATAGGQYPRSGKGLYPPWKGSTGADKSGTSSLTFLTATTFEAFSCHPRRRCCCRGCRSAPRSGDRPRTAAAAASAPCPCEQGHS